ncbi:MAG: winged helix-turn-helix domain-containing protein, partial [Thermoanaerobaculia bacterium]
MRDVHAANIGRGGAGILRRIWQDRGENPSLLRFADYELDSDRHLLTRRGRELRAEPKVLSVLSYLVRHRDRVVPKEELLDELWEERYVSESALTRVIRDLRRLLEDSSTEPRFIRTIYGKGFLFVAEVESAEIVEKTRASIAVLPFADLSAEHDQGWFCEGLADEIINALTKVASLDVLSRKTSSEASRADIGRLGVAHVLEGSVRKSGMRMRVSVHLVEVASGRTLWSERYDRDAADFFAVQEDIAERAATALVGVLGEGEQAAIHRGPRAELEAWELYLKGRQLAYQEVRRSLEAARQLFARSVEIQPNFALGWCGMSAAMADLYLYHVRDEVLRDGAEETSRRAVEIDPSLAEAHTARGQALVLRGAFDEAADEFETAIALDPRSFDAHFLYARLLWTHAHSDAALAHLERAAAIRSDDYLTPTMLLQVYYALGRESDRHNAALRTEELTRKRLDLRPDDVRALCMNAEAHYILGERSKALEQIEQAYAIDPHDVCTLYNSACVFALDGAIPEALDAIEGAVRGGYTYREWLEHDP